jgi:hypothetical protein
VNKKKVPRSFGQKWDEASIGGRFRCKAIKRNEMNRILFVRLSYSAGYFVTPKSKNLVYNFQSKKSGFYGVSLRESAMRRAEMAKRQNASKHQNAAIAIFHTFIITGGDDDCCSVLLLASSLSIIIDLHHDGKSTLRSNMQLRNDNDDDNDTHLHCTFDSGHEECAYKLAAGEWHRCR